MKTSQINEILKLNLTDRINLVELIWDSISSSPDCLELTESQKKELDERLEEYTKDPEQGISWDELVGKIKNGK